jgi:hypothetical protein
VAHLDVQDHSARFWDLLETRCQEWREHERWLRRHGNALQLRHPDGATRHQEAGMDARRALLPAEEAHGEE